MKSKFFCVKQFTAVTTHKKMFKITTMKNDIVNMRK